MEQITTSNKNSNMFFAATDIISSFLTQNLRDRTGLQADLANCFDCMVRDRLITYWFQLIFKYFQSFSNYLRDWNVAALRFPFQKLVVLSIQSNLNRFIFNHFYNPIYYHCTPMVYNHSVAKKVSPSGSNRLGESWLRLFEFNHLNSQHYEYNTPRGTLCTPCSTLYPYPDVGGTVMERKFVGFSNGSAMYSREPLIKANLVTTPQLRRDIAYKYRGRCFKCGIEEWRYKKTFNLHRVIPGKLGGTYIEENVIPVCSKCHQAVEGLSWDKLTGVQSIESKWIEEIQ